MTEYSRMAKGNFTATGTTAIIPLPFTPDYVEIWNYSIIKTAAIHSTARAWWDNKLLDGSNNPTMLELYSGSSTSTVYDIVTNTSSNLGINPFSGGQLLQFGPTQQIVSITAANPAVVTVTGHGYQVGDTVLMEGLFQSATTGMPQINGIPFTISAVTTNTFTINWNASTSNYTALSGSPASAKVKKILFPFLYLPEDNVIASITLGATTTISTTMIHNLELGQEVAFRVPNAWGTTQLNSLPNLVTPGSPIYGYVQSITDNWTFVVNINSNAFTAFTANIAVANVPGLTFAQVVPVGDVNTGGIPFTGGNLYPSPIFGTTSSTSGSFPTLPPRASTINGPAVRGAFVNNTSQGFTIGAGIAATDGTATIIANGNIIYWHAYLHDFANP